jgi:deoxyribonuclease V
VAGVDVTYHMDRAFSAVVVMHYETLELVESATAMSIVEIPYISSFLAFRELRPMMQAVGKLREKPDVFLVDAHGIAHPERCGCASHFGVVLDVPTIGVGKSLLIGEVSDFDDKGVGYIKDREEIVGAAMVSKAGCKPIVISIGHKVSLNSAIEIVGKTTRNNRIPEPLRLAHRLSHMVRASARQ